MNRIELGKYIYMRLSTLGEDSTFDLGACRLESTFLNQGGVLISFEEAISIIDNKKDCKFVRKKDKNAGKEQEEVTE